MYVVRFTPVPSHLYGKAQQEWFAQQRGDSGAHIGGLTVEVCTAPIFLGDSETTYRPGAKIRARPTGKKVIVKRSLTGAVVGMEIQEYGFGIHEPL